MPRSPQFSLRQSLFCGCSLLLVSSAALLTGCAMNSGNGLSPDAKVSGTAFGGRQPVVGATVNFYATGKTGYGSAATLLGTATSGSSGQFSITLNGNSCSDPQQVYLVATGGDPGAGTNSASVLVEALGKCSSITSATNGLVINELTTIAAAYALQGFADTTFNIGTSSTNAQGLTHAFANAANLVALNGVANTATAGGNGTVPNVVLNTLADILADCENSTGPGVAPCTTVLAGAPTVVGASAPSTLWQEALDMARYPGYDVAALYGVVTATSPFQPTLAAQPNDLSVAITYSAGYYSDGTTAASYPWDIKADSYDNVWVSGMYKTAGSDGAGLVELSPAGAVLSPNGGWGSSTLQNTYTRNIAVDTTGSGNIWVADATGNIWKYTPGGTSTSPTQGTTTQVSESTVLGPVALAVDSGNNLWFATYNSTASASQGIGVVPNGSSSVTFPPNSAPASTKGAYTMAIDVSNNDIFVPTQSGSTMYEYLGETSTSTTAATAAATPGTSASNGVAVDKNHNVWLAYTATSANGGTISKYAEGATAATYTCKTTGSGNGSDGPRGLLIDGNNRLFINSYSAGTIVEFDPALGTGCGDTNNDAGTFFLTSGGAGYNPSSSAGTGVLATSGERNSTIDSSGAFWTINSVSTAGYSPVVQVLGIAAPTDPVLAAGAYGVKP